MPLIFEKVRLDCGYRIDLMVNGKLVIEVKSVEALNDIYLAQTLTYLMLIGCRVTANLSAVTGRAHCI